jgi:hypothetical protein
MAVLSFIFFSLHLLHVDSLIVNTVYNVYL